MIYADIKLGEDPENKIVHITTNEELHPEVEDNEYMRILKKILSISLVNHVKGAILNWTGELDEYDINQLIQLLRNQGYEYACFWFEGSLPMYEFENELVEWGKENTDWHAMGHLLARNGRPPVFHEQVVVLNLKNIDYRIMFDYVDDNERYPAFEMSEEHVHDDYTPWWIEGTGGSTPVDYTVDEELNHMFDYVLYALLQKGAKVVNVPHEIREEKFCVYPEDDVEHTLNWLTNPEFLKKSYQERYEYKYDEVPGDKWVMYEFLNMSNEVLYITNTEGYPEERLYKKAPGTNIIICPASGLNQFLFAIPHIDTLEKMIWTDFNALSIKWLQYILEHWDGNDFRGFFEGNRHVLSDWGIKHQELLVYTDEQIDELTEMFNEPEMNAKYNKLKDIEHVFLNIDIVNQFDQILPHVKDSNVILQLSNIYSYEINYIVNKYYKAQVAFYSLVNALLESNKNVYLRGDTPSGVYHEMTNIGRVGTL